MISLCIDTLGYETEGVKVESGGVESLGRTVTTVIGFPCFRLMWRRKRR